MKTETDNQKTQAYWLMSKPVEAVGMNDYVREVAYLFTEKNISAAVVLDAKKKPVGVITKTDFARYREEKEEITTIDKKELRLKGDHLRAGFHAIDEGDTVEHWMTPVILSVKPETPMHEIAKQMVKYGVHHIFVQGRNGEPIVGIVSSFDILRKVASQQEQFRGRS